MNLFEKWYQQMNENVDQAEPTTSDAATKSDISGEIKTGDNKKQMMQNVDDIMQSLELLATELTEELNLQLFNESVTGAVVDYTIRAPRARKAQKKVNQMNSKIADLQTAISSTEGDQKEKIKDRVSQLKDQAKQFQDSINDKFADSSKIVKKALSSEKIKGQLDVLKQISGEKEGSDVKDQVQKLKKRLKEEEAAFKEMKPKESVKENLFTRSIECGMEDLALEINSKEEWQLREDSTLYKKYNSIIRKEEHKGILSESYHSGSIKDKFSKLL